MSVFPLRLLRLLAAAPLLAVALATPAHAATMPTCPSPGSTDLVAFNALEGIIVRVSTYDVSPTQKNVCFHLAAVTFNVVVRSAGGVGQPSVTQTAGTGGCAQSVLDMTAPIQFSLSLGADPTTRSICLGKDGSTTTLSFAVASPDPAPGIEVWIPRFTLLTAAVACGAESLKAQAGLGGDFYSCYQEDHQIV